MRGRGDEQLLFRVLVVGVHAIDYALVLLAKYIADQNGTQFGRRKFTQPQGKEQRHEVRAAINQHNSDIIDLGIAQKTATTECVHSDNKTA